MIKVKTSKQNRRAAAINMVLGVIMFVGLVVVMYFAFKFIMNRDFLINQRAAQTNIYKFAQ